MLASMTGFGNVYFENENLIVVSEIKSLNSKYLDINFKLPRNFSVEKELELRSIIQEDLQRGKIGATLDYQFKKNTTPNNRINREVLKAHYAVLQDIARELGSSESDLFRIATLMPDVIHQDLIDEGTSENDWKTIINVFREAVQKCKQFRLDEGTALTSAFEANILRTKELLVKVEEQDPIRAQNIKQKLSERVQDLTNNDLFDKNRFEQEMIYYLEKLDIAEEKVRLNKHLDYFLETLRKQETNGKKLNFISQEIGREINTIGSKANDALIQRYVVEMKEELDKIKEQVLNVL